MVSRDGSCDLSTRLQFESITFDSLIASVPECTMHSIPMKVLASMQMRVHTFLSFVAAQTICRLPILQPFSAPSHFEDFCTAWELECVGTIRWVSVTEEHFSGAA